MMAMATVVVAWTTQELREWSDGMLSEPEVIAEQVEPEVAPAEPSAGPQLIFPLLPEPAVEIAAVEPPMEADAPPPRPVEVAVPVQCDGGGGASRSEQPQPVAASREAQAQAQPVAAAPRATRAASGRERGAGRRALAARRSHADETRQ
jgi:hypothetical protein